MFDAAAGRVGGHSPGSALPGGSSRADSAGGSARSGRPALGTVLRAEVGPGGVVDLRNRGAGVPEPDPRGGVFPWLGAAGSVGEVLASMPGGVALAQVLGTLLTLPPARVVDADAVTVDAPAVTVDAPAVTVDGPAVTVDTPAVTVDAPAVTVGGPAVVPGADEFDHDGPAVPGWDEVAVVGPGLPDWLIAMQLSLEPRGAEPAAPVVPGSGPRAPEGLGGWQDPRRAEADAGRTAESLAAMGAGGLVEVVAAAKRTEAWAAGLAAQAAAELATREVMTPDVAVTVPSVASRAASLRASQVTAAALSQRLGISLRAAALLVATGSALTGVLSATGEALARGEIDWGKARVVADLLSEVPWQVAQAVEDVVLPIAPAVTPGRLRRAVAKALLEVDPQDAAERHARARRDRRVERPVPLPDGMALVRAVLPVDAAVRLDATLSAGAAAAKAAGDGRTRDQLRADGLDALATQAWLTGAINPAGCGGPCCDPGRSVAPGPAEPAARSAPTGPAAPRAPDADAGPSMAPGLSGPSMAPGLSGLAGLVGPFAEGADRCRMRLAHVGKRAQVNVTIDLTTLLGLTAGTGELAGFGPISADLARALARDATWRRLITDPVDGLVIDVGTRKYRPPAGLAELVRFRHPTCVDPMCSVPADRCDTDHHDPWTPAKHNTTADNLGPLCRAHHLLRTHAGYDYVQTSPGVHEITTPTGHRYRTGPGADRDPPF